MFMRLPARCRPIVVVAVLCAFASLTPAARQSAVVPSSASSSALVIDVVAVDRTGAAVDDLGADDFSVTVDGVRRLVTSARYVTRGPGALNDTRTLQAGRQAASGSAARVAFAAEPARTIVVVIDQTTLVRGDEKATTAVVGRVIDRLGLDDRVGVVRLPLAAGHTVTLNSDRPSLLASIRDVMGQATISGLAGPADPFTIGEPERPGALISEPPGGSDRTAAVEQDRATSDEMRSIEPAAREGRPLPGNLPDLRAVISSLGSAPGRKVVLLFSGGLLAVDRARLDDTIAAAVQAHAVVQAFGLKSSRFADAAPDAGALETLARATGGQFAPLGRNVDQAIGRVLADLASCYVLGLEDPAPQGSGMRRPVRVTVARPGVVVRAPAWLVARPDAADTRLPAMSVSRAPGVEIRNVPQALPEPSPANVRDAPPRPRDPGSPAQLVQLRRLLARVADYVETYQREYSSLVAEEHYDQSDWTTGAPTGNVRLKSDLLLVRVDQVMGWVSFRDVFEVDGRPVRERDERLQRLFLDPSVESRARLAAIQSDSTRYNIGPVKRTVNTPLLPLTFLERAVQPRFELSLEGTRDVDGIQVWELDYRETASPTIASTEQGTDQPVRGRFFIDPVSGAVVESRAVFAREHAGQIEYVIRYRRDETLGLWLPVEMKETYSLNGRTLTQGVARYRNFRRFQVSTDTRVAIPK